MPAVSSPLMNRACHNLLALSQPLLATASVAPSGSVVTWACIVMFARDASLFCSEQDKRPMHLDSEKPAGLQETMNRLRLGLSHV